MEKFFYFLLENKSLISRDDIKGHLLDHIDSKIVLWELCKSLPSLKMAIDNWINQTNSLILDAAKSLGTGQRIQIEKKRGLANFNLQDELFRVNAPFALIENITLENIHQIKGRTFEAVMVFIDSGSGNFKISVSKLKQILGHKDLLNGKHHEDGRCFYVAASRARRLLWIASVDNNAARLFV